MIPDVRDLNPIRGKMFELPTLLPLHHTLKITVMVWDRILADDIIENQFLSHLWSPRELLQVSDQIDSDAIMM